MPPKAKNKARAFKSTSTISKSKSSSTEPPEPYKIAPPIYEPFLSKLNRNHVYITHIDSKPFDFKQKIFLVPTLMNVVVVLLVIWRISYIGPWYMRICFSLMGKTNDMTIDTNIMPAEAIVWEIAKRAAVFMIDLCIYVFVWLPFPWDFMVGRKSGSPVAWRTAVGFKNKEIIVRRSRKWYDELQGEVMEKGEGQEKFWGLLKTAVDPMWMNEKTGYAMLNTAWDLDWKLMVIATRLCDKKELSMDDFRTITFVHSQDYGWTVIESAQAGGSAKEEEGRRKIVAFKDELTAMGKENLFFRWIELVQYESSRPEGFGSKEQVRTMEKARHLFESQGVDFDKFWDKLGGMQGMPGMDQM